ncbi:MAG: 4Fe-4S ferredoxin [Chloroflexi bacterium]|nr:4Fe-4S ferredoxin [Chloroflexota bacterium]|tara:strand:- start:8262 stop:10571 length:2310 start_codon:yes stop_codon:yes gene_type:complete
MKLTRRNFLAWAGLSAVGAVACDVFGEDRRELKVQSPVMQPEDLVKGTDNWYATLCRQCPTNEGIVVRVMEGRAKKVQGNPEYPVNLGKQSARCDAGLQALYHPDRLAGPMKRTGAKGSGDFTEITWDQGLDALKASLGTHGDGLLLITEPVRAHSAMIADRFAKAFNGTHLGFEAFDQGVYRTAVKSVFGQDTLPDLDIGSSHYLLSFGADFLSTWGSPTRWSIGYGAFRDTSNGGHRGTHVHVDPRFSMTASNADKWLPIAPGVEGHLALSIAHVIISEGLQADGVDIDRLTAGRGAAALSAYAPERVGPMLNLHEDILHGHSGADLIKELAREFASHTPSLAIGGDSSSAYSNGLFNAEAIYALNYLVGSVGSQIAFSPESPFSDLPSSANVGGLADWSEQISNIRNGKTRLVMIHNADPVYGLPESSGMGEALSSDSVFVVSFSSFIDDTAIMADLILPDRNYLEDWGSDIPEPGPGHQVIGIQQPVVNPLSELDPRSFGDVLLAVGQELGKESDLPWASVKQALRETSDSLYDMNKGSVSGSTKDVYWNSMLRNGGWWDESSDPVTVQAPSGILSDIASRGSEAKFSGSGFYLIPFLHNTLLDGRNAHLPWAQSAPDPVTSIAWQTWVEINEKQMESLGIREGDVVSLTSNAGRITAPAYPNPGMPPDIVGVPLGQGHKHGPDYATVGDDRDSSNVIDILSAVRVDGTRSMAWASNRVQVQNTGDSVRVTKLEGEYESREIGNIIDNNPGEEIIKTTTPGQQGH